MAEPTDTTETIPFEARFNNIVQLMRQEQVRRAVMEALLNETRPRKDPLMIPGYNLMEAIALYEQERIKQKTS
jgi:hypothetical protein